MNDFTLSVSSKTPSIVGFILLGIWFIGIFLVSFSFIQSSLRLYHLKQSALPLQNSNAHHLYQKCLKEVGIKKAVPIYSTAFLKSPIIVGFFKPRIYLPIPLISDYSESEIRYILLHELQHYKYKDALSNYFMNLARIFYWFNPLVLYSLKEMRNDREIACDTSVLKMLSEDAYQDYGNTLINFTEKISTTSFPFASYLSGNIKQMKRRIINIASYEKPTHIKKIKSIAAFSLTAILLLRFAPFISTYAEDSLHYQWDFSAREITDIDLSSYFGKYKGSFVLYDIQKDAWKIYNKEHALLRVPPNSTYKIYDALFALEEGIITPTNSFMEWNKEIYPFESWNADQTLQSALSSSVNWYFQTIDQQLGRSLLTDYMREIGYGNEMINGDLSSYWMESSLKISPIEQVKLLTALYHNEFNFTPENIQTVKNSIFLSSSNTDSLYGKTGSGQIDGQNVNGWFIGYVEAQTTTYLFATNIASQTDADGSHAAKITLSILDDWNIFHEKNTGYSHSI